MRTATSSTIPDALKVGDTYLIYSEVKYKYVPSVAWFINEDERYHSERCHLHPSAPGDLRDVHDVGSCTAT